MNEPRKINMTSGYVLLCIITVACSLLFALSYAGGLLFIGMLLLAISAAAFSVLLLSSRQVLFFLICPVTCILAFFITGSSFEALILSVSYIASGAATALMFRKKVQKTSACLILALIFGAFIIIGWIVSYVTAGGVLSVDGLKSYFAEISSALKTAFSEAIDYIYGIYESNGIDIAQESKIDADGLMTTVLAVLPGMLVSLLFAISYTAVSFSALFIKMINCEILLPDPKYKLLPTSVTPCIFFGAYVVFFITSLISSLDIIYVAALNLILILTPVMFVCGLNSIISRRRNPAMRRSAGLLIFISVAALIFFTVAGIVFVSVLGAWDVIALRKAEKAASADKK